MPCVGTKKNWNAVPISRAIAQSATIPSNANGISTAAATPPEPISIGTCPPETVDEPAHVERDQHRAQGARRHDDADRERVHAELQRVQWQRHLGAAETGVDEHASRDDEIYGHKKRGACPVWNRETADSTSGRRWPVRLVHIVIDAATRARRYFC